MNAKEIFQLAVRLLGLAFLYHGLMYAPLILVNFSFWSLLPNLIMTAWPLAVAYWLVRGAPELINLAYPGTTKPTTSGGESPPVARENR